MKPIQRILVATDFSTGADAAAVVAAQMARQMKAGVDVVTVVDTSPLTDAYGDAAFRTQRIAEIHAEAHQRTADFADRHFTGLEDVTVSVRDGNPFLEILQAGHDLGSDLVVLGTHGRTGIVHLLIGSTAEKVVRKSPIPVVVARGAA